MPGKDAGIITIETSVNKYPTKEGLEGLRIMLLALRWSDALKPDAWLPILILAWQVARLKIKRVPNANQSQDKELPVS